MSMGIEFLLDFIFLIFYIINILILNSFGN
jgi:hypothetical protein